MSAPVDVLSWIRDRVERERSLDRASGIFSGRVEAGEFVYAAVADLIEREKALRSALQGIVASLAEHDDEGMIEHAQQMIAARADLAHVGGAK